MLRRDAALSRHLARCAVLLALVGCSRDSGLASAPPEPPKARLDAASVTEVHEKDAPEVLPPRPPPVGGVSIVVDGVTDDWADVPYAAEGVKIAKDDKRMLLLLELDGALALDESPASPVLLLDADGDANTGPAGTPIVLVGDLNLVGDAAPLDMLLTAPDWSGRALGRWPRATHAARKRGHTALRAKLLPRATSPQSSLRPLAALAAKIGMPPLPGPRASLRASVLVDLVSRHADAPVAYTWRYPTGSFWPGRLDFVIYSSDVLSVARHFVVGESTATVIASDHLPRVVDFVVPSSDGR